MLAKRKLGHRHHLLRRATKRDWVNVSAGIRALGMRARPLLSNADSYRGVHQIVHQLLSRFEIVRQSSKAQKASLFQVSPKYVSAALVSDYKRLTRFLVTAHESAAYETSPTQPILPYHEVRYKRGPESWDQSPKK